MKSFEPLSGHTTFRIGGKARYWYEPEDSSELAAFLKGAVVARSIFVIGAGSNLLVKEGVINKIFVHLSNPSFREIDVQGRFVSAGAGVAISRLVAVLRNKNLTGYEFLAGIPGTIGGALAMNAGAKIDFCSRVSYREMKDIVSEITIMKKNGKISTLEKKEIKFSYRNSSLRSAIILSAKLALRAGSKKQTSERIRRIIKNRLKNQDWRYPSAGSFFKNPAQSMPAGRLIDLCGLKGAKEGGACVSRKHANFIINENNAKSRDVIKLMEKIKKNVYNRFKINLEPEVEIVS